MEDGNPTQNQPTGNSSEEQTVPSQMLSAGQVYQAMDDNLESWLFLVLLPEGSEEIEAWCVGIGNASRLIRTDTQSGGTESDLLDTPFDRHLEPHRRGDVTTIVITPFRGTLPRPRRRVLASDETPTLRGLRHLSIEELVLRYFGQSGTRTSGDDEQPWGWLPNPPKDSSDDQPVIHALWKSLNCIGPLLPKEALTGKQL